jgi:glycerol-3-phosphate acyltransferase PlsY
MSSAPSLQTLLAFGFGYLLGSIPFGLLLTKAAGLGDVRSIGSGNIGATNVLRTGSKKLAAATLFLDGFKGYLAVLLTTLAVKFHVGPQLLDAMAGSLVQSGARAVDGFNALIYAITVLPMAAGLGAYLGHIYPVWLGFKGGKGVATYIGVMLAIAPRMALAFCGLWLVVAFATRYSSLSALIAAVAIPIVLLLLGQTQVALFFAMMSALLFWTHRGNIRRLIAGTEGKIGEKSSTPAEPVA